MARHWLSCVAPVEAVVFPTGQVLHWDSSTAPWTLLNLPKGHSVGEVAAAPLKEPGGEVEQVEEPARGA